MRHVNRGWLRLLLVGATVLLIGGGASVALAAGAPGPPLELGSPASPDQSAFKPLAVGGQHACALPGDGTVMCWGFNFYGQLGDGTTTDSVRPVTVVADADGASPLTGVVAIGAGFTHTCAALSDGTVRCWGDNAVQANPVGISSQGGQLGDGTTQSSLTPVTVTDADGADPLSGVAAISAGWFRTCALLDDGTVACWGDGQLTPAAVATRGGDPLTDVVAIASADFHTCALRADTTVACWGSNRSGELGDGTTSDSLTPVEVRAGDSEAALTGVVAIAVGGGFTQDLGGGFSCALLADTTIRCWGNNDFGQVGDGRPLQIEQPVTTPSTVVASVGSTEPLSSATAITAGCALLVDKTVTCWLGPDRQSTVTDPVGVALPDLEVIASGMFGFCAVFADGTIVCPRRDPAFPGLVIVLPTPQPEPSATAEPAPAETAEPEPEPTGDLAPAAPEEPQPTVDLAPQPPADVRSATPFRASVPTPAEVTLDPAIVAQSLVIAAVIVLLVPFPGVLFNSTVEANYPEITERARGARRRLGALFAFVPWRRRRSRIPVVSQAPPDADSASAPVTTEAASRNHAKAAEFWTTMHGITLFLGLTALLGSFLDPTFGPDTQSLATFVGLVVGLVVTIAAFGLPVAFTFRRSAVPFMIRALPGTLLVGLACVLISRLTDFQPGYLYGLVIGVAARELSVAAAPRTVAVATATTLIAAFVAWFAMLWVGPLASATDAGFIIAVVQTALATTLVAGLEGVFFGMLPIRFLPGETVFRWNRKVWAALFGTATIGFLLILMNPASGYLADGTRTPMFTILALLLGFGIGSVAFWAYFRFRRPPVTASATP